MVFVLGCEMSLFNSGFVPGANYIERIRTMMNPPAIADLPLSPDELLRRFNAFLGQTVAAVRERFGVPIT